MSDVDHSTKVERAGEVRAGAAKANPTLEGENRSLAELKQGGASCEATGAGATADAGEAGGGTDLGTALRMVLDHGPEQGSSRAEQDDTALRTIEAWPSLADRQQLWQAPALWVERFWGEQQRSSQRWRALVDPLPDALIRLGATSGAARVALLATACAHPALRLRLSTDLAAVQAIVAGLDGLQALRAHYVLAHGQLPPRDDALTARVLLEAGDPNALAFLRAHLPADRELALALAEDRALLDTLRDRDPGLADAVDTMAHDVLSAEQAAAPGAPGGWIEAAEEPIDATVRALLRARAGAALIGGWLDRYRDIGPQVLDALESGRARLRALASGPDIDATRAEARVRAGLKEVGRRYEGQASPLELLDCIDDPYTRRRAAQLLGREEDALAVSRAALSRAGGGDQAVGEQLDALVERCGRIGAMLAEAVVDEDSSRALAIAQEYRNLIASARSEKLINSADNNVLSDGVAAGYRSVGGNLAHGVARLANANDVFIFLGLQSTALALKSADDTRSDEVVQAEFNADARLAAFFRALVNGDPATALALTEPTPDGLMAPATQLQPDAPLAYLKRRYLTLYGVGISAHVARSSLATDEKSAIAHTLGVQLNEADAPPASQEGADHLLQPEFFKIDNKPIDGVPRGEHSPRDIDNATAAHVAKLVALTDALGGWHLPGGADPQKALTVYLAQLTLTGGRARVLAAFAQQQGAGVEFYLQQARTNGDLDDVTAGAALRLVKAEELSPVCLELRGEADAGQWDEVLATVNDASFAGLRRASLLEDGATLAYLRGRAPSADAWDLFYRSATGELNDAELEQRDGGVAGWGVASNDVINGMGQAMGAAGRRAISSVSAATGLLDDDVENELNGGASAERYVDNPFHYLLTGDQRVSYHADTDRLRKLRDKGVDKEDRRAHQAERLTDVDMRYRLERQHGGGNDRRHAEYDLLGQGGTAKALDAEAYWLRWGSLPALREAIGAMSDAERKRAAEDVGFRQHILTVAGSHAGAYEELMHVLENGPESARAMLHDAAGTGVQAHWVSNDPWMVVDALTDAPRDELWRIATSPEQAAAYRSVAEGDPAALALIDELLGSGARAAAESANEGARPSSGRSAGATWPDTAGPGEIELFTARHKARLLSALHGDTEADVVTALIELASGIAAAKGSFLSDRRARAALEASLRPSFEAACDRHYRGVNSARTTGSLEVIGLFDRALTGSKNLAITIVAKRGADDEGTLLAAIKAAPDVLVARQWASLRQPTRDGTPALLDVYERFRDAQRAAEGASPDSPAVAYREEARVALQGHRVDIAAGALYIDLADRIQANGVVAVDLQDLNEKLWAKARTTLRERISALPAATVHAVVGVAEEDKALVWDAGMRAGLTVAELSDTAQSSLGETSYLYESFATGDNEAALHLAAFAQQIDLTKPGQLTEADLKRLTAMAAEVGGSIAEYDAAREAAAEVASWVATLAATAVAAAFTGPGATPLAAELISSTVAGFASIAVKEAMLGSRYDAEEGVQQLAVDLLSAAMSAGMSEVGGELLKSSVAKQLKDGDVMRFVASAQAATRAKLGKAGAEAAGAVVGAAVKVPWQQVQASAWIAVEEGLVGRGWQDGVDRGLLAFEASISGVPDETARAILKAVADALGEAAVADDPKDASAKQLSAGLSDKPLEAKAFAVMLREKLADVPDEARKATLKKLVSGGANAAMLEGLEWAEAGDEQLSEDRLIGVLTGAAKAGVSKGVSETGKAVQKTRSEHQKLNRQAQATALLQRCSIALQGDERRAFLAWVGTSDHALDAQADAITAHAAFANELWVPLQAKLDLALPDQHSEATEAYRAWVLAKPEKALDLVDDVSYGAFLERQRSVVGALAEQRASAGYKSLSAHEQAWFDHAAAKPEAMSDLSQDLPELGVRVDDDAHRTAFQQGVRAATLKLAQQWVREQAEDEGDSAKAKFIRTHAERLAHGADDARPGDVVARERLIQRIDRLYEFSTRG